MQILLEKDCIILLNFSETGIILWQPDRGWLTTWVSYCINRPHKIENARAVYRVNRPLCCGRNSMPFPVFADDEGSLRRLFDGFLPLFLVKFPLWLHVVCLQGWGPRGLASTSRTARGQNFVALALALALASTMRGLDFGFEIWP